jgi:hypothetical protein
MRGLTVVLLAIGASLLGAAFAEASSPVLTAVTVTGGQTRAVWSLPTNVTAEFVELAKNDPEVSEFGYFRQRNVVSFDVLSANQRSYTDDLKLLPGTYYIHIAGHDGACTSCPSVEFSRIMKYTVSAAGTGTGTDAGPTPTKASDKRAPRQTVRFKRLQDVDRLSVRASMDERGTLAMSASVTVPGASAAKRFKFKSVTRSVKKADSTVTLRLRLPKQALRAVKRALGRGVRLRARVRLTAVDLSGNSRRKSISIRLKR